MKVLIIGGTGLISQSITRGLVERGNDVTLYNRGLSWMQPHPGAKVIHGDRENYPAFEAQMTAAGRFDVVIDMVGYAPGDAESAVRSFNGRTSQFIFCSTVDVYQKPARHYPVTEAESYGGLNEYSIHKVQCEKILLKAANTGAFALTIIRPAYTYGEGRGPVHTFGGHTRYLDRIRKGKPVIVHGDGNSFWTACHRDDVAKSFVTAAGNSKTWGKAYHVTGEEWMTWDTYVRGIAKGMDAPEPVIIHIPTDVLGQVAPKRAGIVVENFQFNNIFDNSAAKSDLDFTYTVPWVDGVRRIVDWLDANDKIENSDLDPYDDRLIAAWQKLGDRLGEEFCED